MTVDGRVLLVLGPSTGGIRAHVGELRRRLTARGWEVAVAGPAGVLDGVGPLEHVVAVPDRLDLAGVARAARALHRVAPGYDLVHAHGLKAGWVAALGSGPGPVVVTLHNTVLAGQGGRTEPMLRWFERRLPGRVDAVIAASPELATGCPGAVMIRPVGPAPVVRRPAAEVRAALGVDPGTALVVGVGRLHPQKGWLVLLDALGLLPTLAGHRVVILGEGPQHHELVAAVAERGLGATVHLAGPSRNPADELAAADVVVSPSLWESGPLVVAEALALARPVVATATGFVPALVTDGVDGRVVAPGEAGPLAAALTEVLADPSAAAAMGAAGPAAVAALLDPDQLVDEVAAVYRATLARA